MAFLSRNVIVCSLAASPVLLIVVLIETSMRNAYPADGDSIVIPFVNYLIYFFAFSMVVTAEIDRNANFGNAILFWNPKRNARSLLSLLVSAWLMWFWLAFLVISIQVFAIGSAAICLLMFVAIPIARTMAIQNVESKPNKFLGDAHLNGVTPKLESLDDRFEELKAELDQLKGKEA